MKNSQVTSEMSGLWGSPEVTTKKSLSGELKYAAGKKIPTRVIGTKYW